MADWELARKVALRAHCWRGRLYLDASADKPGPRYEVAIEEDRSSQADYLVQWMPPEGPEPTVMTPFWVTLSDASDARSVTVRTADGICQVQVEGLRTDPSMATNESEEPLGQTVVGHSDRWDLAEAMRDAVRRLPDAHGDTPDWLYNYTVISIGAEVGGIAGIDRMRVEVQGQ